MPFQINFIVYLSDKHSSYLSFRTANCIQVPLSTSDLMTDLITLQHRSVDLAKKLFHKNLISVQQYLKCHLIHMSKSESF